MQQDVILTVAEAPIAKVVINRDEHLNTLTLDVLRSLKLALERIRKTQGIRVLIVSSASDDAFCAGIDVPSVIDLGEGALVELLNEAQALRKEFQSLPFPVLASVNAAAIGAGLEIALSCDIVVSGQDAKFGLPEVNLGIMPSWFVVQRLLARCGEGAAKRLLYTGEIIDAAEAHRIGLSDYVAPTGDLNKFVRSLAQEIASKAPCAISAIKCSDLFGMNDEVESAWRESYLKLFASRDRLEGMQAFLQKKVPGFEGK